MKTLPDKQEFHASGVKGKINYEVVSNAKMMKMLSDGLYQDKIAAPIRELSTNAWDSHVDANNLKPFDVQLPSENDPVFRIRDYGTGMSPQKVEHMYRKYGESDKTDSNSLQGCMGLGSKSPFAYTNQFVSITYYNSKKITWINSKDAIGIPSLIRMSVESTTEPNGFEVSFSVKREDIDKFRNKSQTIYRPFPVKPNITDGYGGLKYEEYDFVMEGENWGIRQRQSNYYNTNISYVVMGYVEYPIEPKYFTGGDKDEDLKWYQYTNSGNNYTKLLNLGLVILMDIGDVEMDISREALQYHKLTVDAIKAKLDIILTEIRKRISEKFVNCKNLWEARCLYKDLQSGELRNLSQLCDLAKIEWKGHDLTKPINYYNFIHFEGNSRYNKKNSFLIPYSKNDLERCYLVNDVERGAYAASKRLATNGEYKEIYLLKFENEQEKKDFLKLTGLPEQRLVYVSSLPKPKRTKRQKVQDIFSFNKNIYAYFGKIRSCNAYKYWQEEDIELGQGGIYVEINRYKIVLENGDLQNLEEFAYLLEHLEKSGLTLPKIYGIKTRSIEKFKNHKEWKRFEPYIKQKFKELLQSQKINKDIATIKALRDIYSISNTIYRDIAKIQNPNKHPNSLFYSFIDKINRVQQLEQKYNDTEQKSATILKAIELLGLTFTVQERVHLPDLEEEEKKILEVYEMLNIVDRYDIAYRNNGEFVINYINLVDSQRRVT